ncbi:MAG: ComF family protein [Clostridia bacterium]|nr:ComF family protein [Clostridia bacterium]
MKNSPLRDIFFPLRCCGCDKLTGSTLPFCEDCAELVIRPDKKSGLCDVCGLSLSQCLCGKRLYYERFSAVFYHEKEARKNIFRLKFHLRRDIADSFAKAILLQLSDRDFLARTDIISFIPMRPLAKFLRGYNQAELIAKRLSVHSGIPCMPLLKKEFSTKNQHKLPGIARSGNLSGVFEPDKRYTEDIKGKNILIIDDVCTTGNTLNEAAKTLLIFGAEAVFTAVCNVRKKDKKTVEQK